MSDKWSRMGVRRRAAIIARLGGVCWQAGPDCDGILTIDHIEGRDYDLEKLSSHQRVKRYEQEERDGKLGVLCWYHNRKKGKP